jgi:hypothetical protein
MQHHCSWQWLYVTHFTYFFQDFFHCRSKNKNTKTLKTTFRKKLLRSSGPTVKNPDIHMLAVTRQPHQTYHKRYQTYHVTNCNNWWCLYWFKVIVNFFMCVVVFLLELLPVFIVCFVWYFYGLIFGYCCNWLWWYCYNLWHVRFGISYGRFDVVDVLGLTSGCLDF